MQGIHPWCRRPTHKNKLHLGCEKTVEDPRQALEPLATFLVVRTKKMCTGTFRRSWSRPTEQRDNRQPACWRCGRPRHFQGNCSYETKDNQRWRRYNVGCRNAATIAHVHLTGVSIGLRLPRTGYSRTETPSADNVGTSAILVGTADFPERDRPRLL
jgi:hypothetical protein